MRTFGLKVLIVIAAALVGAVVRDFAEV